MGYDRKPLVSTLAFTVSLLGTVSLGLYVESQKLGEWKRLKVEKACFSESSGRSFAMFGVGENGYTVAGVGVVEGKSGWKCSEGSLYYR